MTIRHLRSGQAYTHASWLGHSWVRVWMPETQTDIAGYLHFGPGEFIVLWQKDIRPEDVR
jgi:hypothetical protein